MHLYQTPSLWLTHWTNLFSLLILTSFVNKVRCSGLLGRTFDAKFKQTAAKLFSAEFLLKAALLQNGKFNIQQFINHVLFDIYWQNMKFNIQKYIGDVLSGGDGWPISLLVQGGSHQDFTNYLHKT